jgi:RES domain-containing protein
MLKTFKGIAFRSHDPKWAFLPNSGEGAKITGGRFNQVGTSALYLSLTNIGALIESQQGFNNKAQPKLICAYEVDVTNILDLTDALTVKHYGINTRLLDCAWMLEDEPYSQVLSTQLFKQGVNGLIYSSYAKGGEDCLNLVLWRWTKTKPNKVIVVDDFDALPKNQLSWLNK